MAMGQMGLHESKVIGPDPMKIQYQTSRTSRLFFFAISVLEVVENSQAMLAASRYNNMFFLLLLQRHGHLRVKHSRLIPSFGSTKRHLSVIARVLQYSVLPVVENSQYRTNAVGTNQDLF